MEKLKKIFSILARVLVSVILIIFLFRGIEEKSLFEILSRADKGLMALSFLIFLSNYVLGLWRWQMLLKAVNIHLPLKRIIISYCGGLFFNLFLPSSIGGDFMRSVDLAAHTKQPQQVITTVLLDRLSGYIGLVLLALVSFSFGWKLLEDKSILLAISLITGMLVIILLVLFNNFVFTRINKFLQSPKAGKIRELIRNLHSEIYIFKHKKPVILKNLSVSVLLQVLYPAVFYIIALALGLKISIIYFLIFIPIIGAITLLPISIGGLGLRDATTIFFFTKVGVSKDLAFAMSLINFSFILLCGVMGGLIYVFTLHHRRLQYHQPS